MSQLSNDQTVNLFKTVYGKMYNLTDDKYMISKEIPWEAGNQVGDSFVEAFVLSSEAGITIAGQGQDAFQINPAIPGAVKQSSIKPYQTVMSSILPFAFMSRAAKGGEEAFFNSTKYLMKNHLQSHGRLKEILRIYGQAAAKLGYVSYAPSGTVYRGATYSGNGNVILTKADGSTITFTAGVNTTSKAILMAPGSYAAGIFTGMSKIVIKQIDSTGAVVAQGTLIGNDADLGIIYVDFTPVAASGLTSHRICFDGMETDSEMVGINKIISNTGTLFGINAATYELFQGNIVNVNAKRFNLKAVELGVMAAVNKGGLEEPLDILVSPRVFAYMVSDEAAFRNYDASYKSKSANNGFETIEFFAANGVNRIRPYRYIKEGEAYGMKFSDWARSGSAEVSFSIPGMNQEVIFPLENQAGYVVRSYSDEFIVCRAPAQQILWQNINPEGVAF